jgi:phenylalanyl-tRNA synthetase beta chain
VKVSVNWLKELVAVDLGVDELARVLTMGGLEVEEIQPVAAAFTGIVVGHVKSVAPHPNADKLRVTQVDAGTGALLDIVCGAPNVAVGQKVPTALVGAKLPGMEIRKAKLRGAESNGMLCSARELGMSDDHAGLLVLPDDAPVGQDIRTYLDLDDVVFTLKLTPNRGDCLSMFGLARDLAAITGAALRLPVQAPVVVNGTAVRKIRLTERKACSAYYGRVVSGMDPARRTPAWMARRLERAGHRPISPLVDITNYVMLERGQPMHAFDNAKLRESIDVRFAKPGETLKLLNGQWAEYIPNLLVIADGPRAVGLGGVMGGFETMVTGETTDVFFEAAFFDPEIIQGKARELSITSDAAHHFERGVDFGGTRAALERASALAVQLLGGEAGPVTEDIGDLPARPAVRVRPPRVNALLGYDVPVDEMAAIFTRLHCHVERETDAFVLTPPTWRFDLAIEEDFVEEVARVHGYEHVPSTPPRSSVPMLATAEGPRTRTQLKHAAAALGYQEVISYSFVPDAWEADFVANYAPVRLANPIASTMNVMRSTLLGGLVAAVQANLNRDESGVRLFEVGRCFLGTEADLAVQPERLAAVAYGPRLPEQWSEKGAGVDFFDLKGDLEALAGSTRIEFRAGTHPACHPGRCALVFANGSAVGVVGEMHPRLQQRYELALAPVLFEIDTAVLLDGAAPHFTGVSRMPVVRRDIAVLVPEALPVGDILAAVRAKLPGPVREFEVFDQYRGKGVEAGKKSLAFRVVMQDTDRTLTDADVEGIVASIREQLVQQFQAQART